MTKGIELTQCGQPRPYADSIYAGTVIAETEEDARRRLAKLLHTDKILDKQSAEWWRPYFTRFEKTEDNTWKFRIVREYTG